MLAVRMGQCENYLGSPKGIKYINSNLDEGNLDAQIVSS